MKKKTIAIIVALLAVLIGLALFIGNDDGGQADKAKTGKDKATEITELGDDVDVSGGVEESVFDDDGAAAEDDSDSEKDAEPEDSKNNDDDDETTETKKPADADADADDGEMDYERFHAMDPSDQQKYMESFEDLDAFFDWYNDVKEQYAKENPSIEIDGGPIDLEELD